MFGVLQQNAASWCKQSSAESWGGMVWDSSAMSIIVGASEAMVTAFFVMSWRALWRAKENNGRWIVLARLFALKTWSFFTWKTWEFLEFSRWNLIYLICLLFACNYTFVRPTKVPPSMGILFTIFFVYTHTYRYSIFLLKNYFLSILTSTTVTFIDIRFLTSIIIIIIPESAHVHHEDGPWG